MRIGKRMDGRRFPALALGLPLLLASFLLTLNLPALAASEIETSAAKLVQLGILEGDETGNLNLDKGLTRAELAVLLTRLDFATSSDGLEGWRDWGVKRFSSAEHRYNPFTDVPSWALPYIEYCYEFSWLQGVSATAFDPQGAVSPQMACTVILRYCGFAETDWSYDTSVGKAVQTGLAPETGLDGGTILRGTVAVMITRAMNYIAVPAPNAAPPPMPAPEPAPAPEQPVETIMTMDEMKMEIVRLTNEERAKAGLPALEVLPALMDCAQLKADDMRENHYYGHNSPVYGTPGEMIRSFVANTKGTGENLATWTNTLQGAVEGWMGSPGHRDNILEPRYTHIGIGIVQDASGGYCWVQQFAALA